MTKRKFTLKNPNKIESVYVASLTVYMNKPGLKPITYKELMQLPPKQWRPRLVALQSGGKNITGKVKLGFGLWEEAVRWKFGTRRDISSFEKKKFANPEDEKKKKDVVRRLRRFIKFTSPIVVPANKKKDVHFDIDFKDTPSGEYFLRYNVKSLGVMGKIVYSTDFWRAIHYTNAADLKGEDAKRRASDDELREIGKLEDLDQPTEDLHQSFLWVNDLVFRPDKLDMDQLSVIYRNVGHLAARWKGTEIMNQEVMPDQTVAKLLDMMKIDFDGPPSLGDPAALADYFKAEIHRIYAPKTQYKREGEGKEISFIEHKDAKGNPDSFNWAVWKDSYHIKGAKAFVDDVNRTRYRIEHFLQIADTLERFEAKRENKKRKNKTQEQ